MNKTLCVELALTDWTLTEDEILQEAFRAISFNIDTLACLPSYLPNLVNYLHSNQINLQLSALLDWPTGCGLPLSKEKIVIDAVRAGATKIDLVCNSSLVDEGNLKLFKRDVRGAIAAANEQKVPIRIVLSHEHLSLDLVLNVAKCLKASGVDELILRTGQMGETSDELVLGHIIQEKTEIGVTVNIMGVTQEITNLIKKCDIVGIQLNSVGALNRFCRLHS